MKLINLYTTWREISLLINIFQNDLYSIASDAFTKFFIFIQLLDSTGRGHFPALADYEKENTNCFESSSQNPVDGSVVEESCFLPSDISLIIILIGVTLINHLLKGN